MKTVAVFLPVVVAVAVFLCDVDARRGKGQGRARGREGGLASGRGGPLGKGRGGGGQGSPESTAAGSRPPTAGDGGDTDSGPIGVRGKDRGPTGARGKDRGPTDVPGKDRGPTDARGKDRGPIGARGKGRGPTDVSGKDRGPIGARGKDRGPTGARGKDRGPTDVPDKDRGPTGARGKDHGPTGARGKDRGPTDVPDKDRGPIGARGKDRGPTGARGKDRGPTDVPGKDRGPIGARGKDRGPTGAGGKDRGPTDVPGKDRGPIGARGKDRGPTGARGKDRGPTDVPDKDRGPTGARGKDRGPTGARGKDGAEPSGKRRSGLTSRDAAGVALPSRLPGLPLDPADGQVSVTAWQRRVDDADVGQVGVAAESEEQGDWVAVSTYGPGLAAVGLSVAATLYDFPDAAHTIVVTRTRGGCYLIPTPDGLNFASAAAEIASRNGTTVTAAVTEVQLNASGGGLDAEHHHNLTASNPSLAAFCAFLPIYSTSHADPLTFPAPGEEAEGEVVTSVVTLDSKVSIVGEIPRRPRHGKKKNKRKSKKEAGR